MVAKYLGNPDADLPSFVRMGPTGNAGAGYLGPQLRAVQHRPRRPAAVLHRAVPDAPRREQRRGDLLRLHGGGVRARSTRPSRSRATAWPRSGPWRLLRADRVFDITQGVAEAQGPLRRHEFGRGCLLARKLVEAGVPFVEVGQDNYDSHADNFVCHKANMQRPRPGLVGPADDLEERGLLAGHAGRVDGRGGPDAVHQQPRRPRPLHPRVDDRAGRRRHQGRAGLRRTDADGKEVKDNPVSEGDLFATIYTALGINPRVQHYVGTRPDLGDAGRVEADPDAARMMFGARGAPFSGEPQATLCEKNDGRPQVTAGQGRLRLPAKRDSSASSIHACLLLLLPFARLHHRGSRPGNGRRQGDACLDAALGRGLGHRRQLHRPTPGRGGK